MATQIIQRECQITEKKVGVIDSSGDRWRGDWTAYKGDPISVTVSDFMLYHITGTGDGHKTRIDFTFHAEVRTIPENHSVRFYLYRVPPTKPNNHAAVLAYVDVDIDDYTKDYSVTITGFDTTEIGELYLMMHSMLSSTWLYCQISQKVNVTIEVDDTPPTCSMWMPSSGEEKSNYNDIGISFGVTPPAGMFMSEAQLQCSYDNNDWTNPVVSQTKNNYTVPAYTFHGGTIYCRCRAKTAYSEWGEWGYGSFTAVERTITVTRVIPNFSYHYRSYKQPIELSWETNAEIDHITLKSSELQYSTDDGTTWIDLDTVDGDVTSYTVPANFFPARGFTSQSSYYGGGIRWRVRCYNANDKQGQWNQGVFATLDNLYSNLNLKPSNSASVNETKIAKFQWDALNNIGEDSTGERSGPTNIDIEYRYPDGNWQPLSITNLVLGYGACTCEVPANTFNPSVIYWHVRSYNQDGIAGDWSYEAPFSTIDKPQVSTAISPINTVEDADKPILFTWSIYSQSGEASRGADLEYSLDGNSWIAFGHKGETGQQYSLETAESFDSAEDELIAEPVAESTQTDVIVPVEWSIEDIENDQNKDYYTAPAGLIPPGVIFWHVRSYNRNLSPGEWSDSVSFVAKAAPVVQDLQVTAKPWATVIWQSNDQQNYEIFVDRESLGIFFGTERQYPLPDYLKDGVHTIGLRVLGSFDLWSRIAETQVTIENTPTSTLTLKAPTNIDTALEWTGGSGDFFVYRDGLMIAHTNAHSFTDRTALGEHDYQVIERLASGDYNASAAITRTPDVDCLHIAALSGGEWIAIPHRLKNESDPEYSESQEVVYNHLAGIYEPVASIGQYRDDSGKYSAVFLFNEQEEHKRFRALRGKPVILKTADGEVVIGILHAWERKHVLNHYKYAERREMYAAYSFTIQRIGWGDYIDVP